MRFWRSLALSLVWLGCTAVPSLADALADEARLPAAWGLGYVSTPVTPPRQSGERSQALRLFLDCPRCDGDYLRTAITYVNYVIDREDAQLHVLVTTQPTGGGGTEFTLMFIGREEFAGLTDQHRYVSTDTEM